MIFLESIYYAKIEIRAGKVVIMTSSGLLHKLTCSACHRQIFGTICPYTKEGQGVLSVGIDIKCECGNENRQFQVISDSLRIKEILEALNPPKPISDEVKALLTSNSFTNEQILELLAKHADKPPALSSS